MPHPLALEAARNLLAGHDARASFAPILPRPSGADAAFAYDVQEHYNNLRIERGRESVAGYKIGLTTPVMQKLCGGSEPISGVMFASGIRSSPATVRRGAFVNLGIESEVAVRIGRPLPEGRITRRQVAAAITQVAAAFELIEDRNADYTSLEVLSMAADNSWHAGLVLGPAAAPVDLTDRTGVLSIDGREDARGSTRDVLGHPLDAVAWLANHLAARGKRIEPGHWVSTGSIAPIRWPAAGAALRFTVEGLAPVELELV